MATFEKNPHCIQRKSALWHRTIKCHVIIDIFPRFEMRCHQITFLLELYLLIMFQKLYNVVSKTICFMNKLYFMLILRIKYIIYIRVKSKISVASFLQFNT